MCMAESLFLEWVQRHDLLGLVLEGKDIPEELVLRAQEGDEDARSKLAMLVQQLAMKYLLGHQMQPNDAEDLANDVVMVVLRKLKKGAIDPERGFKDPDQVDRFTMGVTKKLRAGFYRKKVKYSPTVLGGTEADPISARDQSYLQQYMGQEGDPEGLQKMVRDEDQQALRQALEKMRKIKPQWYELITHYLDDPTYESIQQAMGFGSINQVKGMLWRAKNKLKELMGKTEAVYDEYLDLLLETLFA